MKVVKSLLWIVLCSVVIHSLAFGGLRSYLWWRKRGREKSLVPIKAIIQTGPQKEALKTAYLAEILDLSYDRPLTQLTFNLSTAKAKLIHSPVIKDADVKIQEPGVLYIDYTIRQPVALLFDYENIALDQEGVPFPMAPFYSPKKFPEICLGIEESLVWNHPIRDERLQLAFDLLKILSSPPMRDLFNVQRIDVSKAFDKSYGRREIVLQAEDELITQISGEEVHYILPRLLRLSTKRYTQELANYLKLRQQMLEQEKLAVQAPKNGQLIVYEPTKTIDFRIAQLAFIEQGDKE